MSLFKQKNKGMNDQQAIATLISEGCHIDGNIKAPNFVRIDGQVTGDVKIEEGMILGEKGVINGNIFTKEIIVYGTINGNIQTDSLSVRSTGRINGEIKTKTLEVEMGAVYNGKLSTNESTVTSEPVTVSAKRVITQVAEVPEFA